MLLDWLQLGSFPLAFSIFVVFCASLVRGFTGFGFSALSVTGMTLVLAPTEVVPIVLMMEVLASIGQLPTVWREVKWRTLSLLLAAIFFGAPLGVYSLKVLPETLIRALISILILLACLALLRGFQIKKSHPAITLGTGFFAGTINGFSGAGGLPVAIFFLASSTAANATRASLIALFLILDVYTSLLNVQAGLLGTLELKRLAIFTLPLALGVFLGSKQFIKSNPDNFKRFAIYLLIFLAALGLLRLVFS